MVREVLRVLLASKESKFIVIREELSKTTIDEHVRNLRTHGLRKLKLKNDDPKRDKGLVLKSSEEAGFDEEEIVDVGLLARQFKRFMKNVKGTEKRKFSANQRLQKGQTSMTSTNVESLITELRTVHSRK